ncbi:MAG: preprotein translocase subunit SecA [Candidatus Omnitrophica bacterium]|nr:preprotein translocase subunit SecA [Candidatus Omnitrophota bacterium]
MFNAEKFAFLENCVARLRQINELEPTVSQLSNEKLAERTRQLKQKFSDGTSLDDLLVEALALVRESSKRTINLRHFDVQLIGGMVLHQGKVAEMATGEGKTLVATLPLYLNALTGKGVHLVTVNDYLAKRDTQWMGPIFHLLGLSVGCIIAYRDERSAGATPGFIFDPTYMPADSRFLYLRPATRKEAYQCDITYGVGSEFGFDYLRDNMAVHQDHQVQRPLHYAIIDEVDSILIDEARTPLIISGPSEESPQLYYQIDRLVRKLVRDTDYLLDEEAQTVALTDEGIRKCERLLGIQNLYDGLHTELVHHINQALRAHSFFKRDKEYVVKNGQVIIVDEFTGRLMPGRRWSDGLHQAIEAKEGVKIESENQTLATISFQNYFRLYQKIAGMTGTALTEAVEFKEIYKLDVIAIPTNRPLRRTEYDDEIYRSEKEKFNAVVEEIKSMHSQDRPVLVGTISIEKAEKLSRILHHHGLPHHVLHGKNHEAEAAIIAQAGRPGAITIATQMAGRGVDIILGGNPEILAREETIQNIRAKITGSQPQVNPRAFLEVINELEASYKKRLEEIEQAFRPTLENLKKVMVEKEKCFSSLDQKVRETFERNLFLYHGAAEFQRAEPRLKKLLEKYQEAEGAHDQAQAEYKDRPEKLKDYKENMNRAYREWDSFRESLRHRFGIVSRNQIQDKAGLFVQTLEKPPARLEAAKKSLERELREYLESLQQYQATIQPLLTPEILSSKPGRTFQQQTGHYQQLLQRLQQALSESKTIEALKEILQQHLSQETTAYRSYMDSLENLEKEIFSFLGGNDYRQAEEAYRKALQEYEKAAAEHQKALSTAREDYERARSQQELEWQKAKEELEKSPKEFKELYETILEKYRAPWLKDHQRVVEAGGLHVIGTERYESRRIDNQLKGRAGRQGDPGSSRFYLSIEDDLLRIFGAERLTGIMSSLPEGDKITHPLITKTINNAQKKVEARNFEIRKQLLEFDNVLNDQRKIIYSLRQDILEGRNLEDYLRQFVEEVVDNLFQQFFEENAPIEAWNPEGFQTYLRTNFGLGMDVKKPEVPAQYPAWRDTLSQEVKNLFLQAYQEKKSQLGALLDEIEKIIMLQVLDAKWRGHLRSLDELREGISLRAYAQKDPLVAYKHEGYALFQEMLSGAREEILAGILRVQLAERPLAMDRKPVVRAASYVHQTMNQFASPPKEPDQPSLPAETSHPPPVRVSQPQMPPQFAGKKVGRNDPCPCGSGKKYKKCCGKSV